MNSVLCVWGYSGPSFCSSGIPYLPKANWGRLQNRDIPCLERSKDSHFATCLGCSSNTNFFSESSNSCFLYFVQGLKACLVRLACLLLKLTAVPFPAQSLLSCFICIPAFNSTAVFEAVSLFCRCEN